MLEDTRSEDELPHKTVLLAIANSAMARRESTKKRINVDFAANHISLLSLPH